MSKITAIRIRSDRRCEVIEIENTLEELQKQVGGYIETVTLATDLVMICDEEGLLKGKSYNPIVGSLVLSGIVGDVLFAGVKGEDFTDVPESFIEDIATRVKTMGYELRDELERFKVTGND